MIARVTTWQIKLGKLEEGIKSFKEVVIPAIKSQKGYRSGNLLVDHKTGKCTTFTFWESKEDAIADEKSGQYRRMIDAAKGRYDVPPARELYEVVAADW